jgi:DNA-binding MurR/RpiR family transcriptional regulator
MSQPAPSPQETMLAARLRAIPGDLTRSEAMIAQWLLLNEAGLALETGASIAAKTGVSEITVSRFLRRLGFRGMAELKAEIGSPAASLHVHATERYMRLLEGETGHASEAGRRCHPGPGRADRAARVGRRPSPRWMPARRGLRDRLSDRARAGRGFCPPPWPSCADRCAIFRRMTRGLVEWVPSARRAGEARALVLVDMVPYAREAEVVVRTACRLGITAVVVTDELNTWAVAHTPFVFHASTKAGAFLESTGPLGTLLNLVTHAVAGRDPDKARRRIASWPAMLRDLGLY